MSDRGRMEGRASLGSSVGNTGYLSGAGNNNGGNGGNGTGNASDKGTGIGAGGGTAPTGGGHQHSASAGSGGALSFLPNLFGRRPIAPVRTTDVAASGSNSHKDSGSRDRRPSVDIYAAISPRNRLKPLPFGEVNRRSPSPNAMAASQGGQGHVPAGQSTPPFDLQSTMELIEKDDQSPEVLFELVQATAVYLGVLVQDNLEATLAIPDKTIPLPPDNPLSQITTQTVFRLYKMAIKHSQPKTPRTVRNMSKRLLAALVALSPPVGQGFVPAPAPITVAALYKIIISNSRRAEFVVDDVYVEVEALKALTKNGTEVDSTEGIVGWLVQALSSMQEEYIKWCRQTGDDDWDDIPRQPLQPFDPIKPANPSEAVCAIIDLIGSIISSHACLFSYADLRFVCAPIFALFWRGATVEHPARAEVANNMGHSTVFSPVRRDSPILSATASPSLPSLHALGIEPGLRRSISLKRSRADTVSSQGTHRAGRQSSMSDSLKSPPMLGIAVRSPSPASGAVGGGGSGGVSAIPGMSSPMGRPKWSRPMTSFAAFFEALYKNVAIPTDVFREAVAVACLAMGQDPDDGLALEVEGAAQALITLALSPAAGRRGENAVRMLLEGTAAKELKLEALKDMAIDRCATRGAVIACNTLISNAENANDPTATCAMASLSTSLRAAQSTSRFDQQKMFAPTEAWELVDAAILGLLQTHLIKLGGLPGQSQGAKLGDAWAEGQAACEIMEGFVPIVTASPHFNLSELRLVGAASPTMADAEGSYGAWMDKKTFEGDDVTTLLPLFEAVMHQLPKSIEHLHSSTSSSPTFYHPKYIDLLLHLGGHLDADDANIVISYYERECLCLPFTTGWIQNIWALVNAFMLSPKSLPEARLRVGKLLLQEVYPFASDMPEARVHLVETVILPLLEKYLPMQQDDEFQTLALKVLVNAAVVETFERDEERRQVRATKASNELEEEDASPEASQEVTEATFSGSFNTIRGLIAGLAHLPCKDEPTIPPPSAPGGIAPTSSSTPSDAASLAAVSRSTSVRKERNLKGTISPPQRSRELPSISSIASPMTEDAPSTASTLQAQVHSHSHADCRSIQAVTSLIAIFTQLCFTPQYHNTQTSAAIRMPASFRSIIVFRDLLGLLYPMTDDRPRHKHTPTQVRIAAKCPKARITILEWMMRLRADQHHRLFIRGKIDEVAMPFAAMLRRTKDTEAEARASEAEEARRRARPVQPLRNEEDRGRSSRSQESSTRSRSRSKAAPVIRGVDHTYNPLWCVPQAVLFATPKTEQSSEIMTTYDPFHPALRNPNSAPIDGVWLPVSQYVRVLNGILRGHDWELVSYVLCFLPLQLRNKLFFHGWRATKEVRALLEVLVDGVMGKGGAWEKRYNIPTFIKRVDINAIAYQSLSIMIAYRGTLRRDECDSLVQAFTEGLQARKELAKPCLQALTLCIYEMEQYMARHLLTIIDRMERIVTTTALAVHILEFLVALGQNISLFRNFTDEQYRRVFHVAIDYITIHNARSDEPVDLQQGDAREEYTLSQHVIGLAYYSIYLWFIALKLPSRPNLVPEITRKLLQGRSKRVIVDEMAEVCFDWLARYTYGNADPRPATSFLSEVVMADEREGEPPKSYSWLLGGAIVTVSSHARTGWATIMTTRPTGSTSIVCKLENVPFLDIGESNADLASLPAFLMATRKEIAPADEGIADAKELSKATSNVASPQGFDAAAQHGFIWSGATPSQRRKDVQIHPSFIALQLLSSYPNNSLETPRGRLIPQEEKFQRALRGIQNTPVIDTLKIAVLYAAPGQYTENEILGNIDGSPLYLDFLSGLGRLIKLKGQVDVFVGGLNRENDSDGEYAYAWWDDFDQVVFHTPTMMPNLPEYPSFDNKKRLVGNDFVKIIYNESGRDFTFDTIRTAFNFINIVISPLTLGEGTILPEVHVQPEDGWPDWDREEWFKVEVQRAPGIPDFAPFGEGRLVSRHSLPILVRQIVIMANDLAARHMHIRGASDAASAEYITSWRSRLRALARLRDSMPKFELPDAADETAREELKRDWTLPSLLHTEGSELT